MGSWWWLALAYPNSTSPWPSEPMPPNLRQLNGIGVVDPLPTELATGNAEPRYWSRATYFGSNLDVVGTLLHRGLVDVGFLGAIEVDQFGNNNTSDVPRADGGVRRFSGGGIANDIASHAKSVVIVVRHEPRRLVERVYHNTSPGFLDGADARQRAGLPVSARLVLTDKCVLAADPDTGRSRRAVDPSRGCRPRSSARPLASLSTSPPTCRSRQRPRPKSSA